MAKKILEILEDLTSAGKNVAAISEDASGIKELARQFGDLKRAHEAIAALLSALGERWDENEKALIEHMIEEGISSVKIEGYGNFILSRSTYPNVNAANKPAFFEYLKASGNEGLLRLDVPTNTLTAFLKKHVEELKAQLTATGLTAHQAQCLSTLPEFSDAAKGVGHPLDEMIAEDIAQAILKSQGAVMFTKTGISLRK
jgi:hypothetical protein